jgi:putative flavoprotein involved in K+ transport
MPNKENIDVVIVGGGQAGISLSYYLQQRPIPHVLLERERAFSSWHKRWDGFKVNTPNWMNTLPVLDANRVPGNDPDGFATREEIVNYLEDCLKTVNPPIRTNTNVHKITQLEKGLWEVHTPETVYETPNVAICIGGMCTPKVPLAAAKIPKSVPQIHSSEYRNPEQIKTKSILIVGSGSSGVQLCRCLVESRKFENIHLAVSNVLVLPEHILGIPTHRFLHFFGLFDVKKNSMLGKLMYSNLETKGDPIMRPTPIDFAKLHNVKLYGKFARTENSLLYFSDGQVLGLEDLTIIWCTGFRGEYSFIETQHKNVFDKTGYPNHTRGVIESVPGLYFVGLRYQHTVASHDLYGVGKDAKYVADHIQSRLTRE